MSRLRVFLLLMILIFVASPVMAAYEYYTYDGFEPIVRAFVAISHVFKNEQMVMLAAVASVIGMTAAGIAYFIQAVSGAQANPVQIFLPAMIGMALYLALFGQGETLIVYDAQTGQFQSVPDVPQGVVIIASAINDIERGMIDIVETAFGGAGSVQQAAGAYNLVTAGAFFRPGVINANLQASLQAYVNDCVLHEMMVNPSGGLNPEALRTSNDFRPLMAQAKNPALFTRYYDGANPNGAEATCAQAWDQLEVVLADSNTFNDEVEANCGQAGFQNSPQQRAKCRSLAEGFFTSADGVAVAGATLENVARQGVMAKAIFETIKDGDPLAAVALQANRTMTSKGVGILATANEWLPYFKASMTAVAIGLIPFMAVFVATPLVGRALSFVFGIFIFLAAWGVADAVATAAGSIYTTNLFTSIRDTGLGLDTFVNFPDYTTKMVTVFATMRSMAVAFAGLISMMLAKFGGHFLSGMASNIMGQVQGAGATGGSVITPEGRAHAMSSMISAAGAESWVNSNSFGTMAGADAWGRQYGTEGYKAAVTKAGATGMSLPEFGYNSQLGFNNVATPKGALSGTVAPDGSGLVNSSLNSAHTVSIGGSPGAPSLNVNPSNLGVISAGASEHAQVAATNQLANQVSARESAGEDLSTATRSLDSNYRGMEQFVRTGAERGDSEAIGLKKGFETAAQQMEAFTNQLSERHHISREAARLLASEMGLGLQAGLEAKGGGALGWLASKISGVEAGGSFGGSYKLNASDRTKLAYAVQHLDNDDWKSAQSVAENHRAAMDQARDSRYVQTSGAGAQYSSGHRAALENSKQAGARHNQEWGKEQTMRRNMETAQKSGVLSQENLNPELQEFLNDKHGTQGAQELLRNASAAGPERAPAMAQLRADVAEFADNKVRQLFAGPVGGAVTLGGETLEAEVTEQHARIKAQVEEGGSPTRHYAHHGAAIDKEGAVAGVSPGKVPEKVNTGLPVPSSEGYKTISKEVKGKHGGAIEGARRDLANAQAVAREDHKERTEETGKVAALGGVLTDEGQGFINGAVRGTENIAGFLGRNMFGGDGPRRMEGVKQTLSNSNSPLSPKHHFGDWANWSPPNEDNKEPRTAPEKGPWQK